MTTRTTASPRRRPLWDRIFAHPYLLLALAPLFWGGNAVAAKLANGEVLPFVLMIARFVGALLVVTPFALPHLKADWPELRKGWAWLFVYGALGFAAFNACLYVGATFTSAINASIEQASIPVFVLLGNFVIFRVRGTLLQIAGVVVTIIGVLVTATHGDLETIASFRFNVGDGLVLLACVLYSGYALTLRFRPKIHWLSFIFATVLGAVVGGFAFLFAFGGGLAPLASLATTSPKGWLLIVYVATFPSVLAQLCFAQGVTLIGPNRASLFNNLIPVFGTVLSVLIIGEQLEPYHLVAAVIVVVGIVLAEFSARPRAQ